MSERVLYKREIHDKMERDLYDKLSEYNLPKHIFSFMRRVKSANSKVAYWNTIEDFLKWKFDDICKLTDNDVEELCYLDGKEYMDYLMTQNISQATINQRFAILASFGTHLSCFLKDEKNFMKGVYKADYKFDTEKKTKELPTKKQISDYRKKIMKEKNEFTKKRDLLIFDTLLLSGLRKFELISMDLMDIHINKDGYSYLTVLRKRKYVEKQMEKVIIPDSLAGKLSEWRKLLISEYGLKESDPVFVNKKMNRISVTYISNLFHKISNGRLSPHMLRHYYSTNLLNVTKDLAFVQEQLGHSYGSSVTLNTYVSGSDKSKNILKII